LRAIYKKTLSICTQCWGKLQDSVIANVAARVTVLIKEFDVIGDSLHYTSCHMDEFAYVVGVGCATLALGTCIA
jgi:hypothetical protein